MDDKDLGPAGLDSDQSTKRPPTVRRRSVIKVAVAGAGGLLLGTTYVKANVVSIGLQHTYAISGSGGGGGQPSIEVSKTIDSVNTADGIITGTITITDVSSAPVGATVESFEDIVEKKPAGPSPFETIGTFTSESAGTPGIDYSPDLVGFSIPPTGSQSFAYTIRLGAGVLNGNTASVRNTIRVKVVGRDLVFHYTESWPD